MKQIPLTNSDLVALVDDADYEWLSQFTWRPRNGYAARSYRQDGKIVTVSMHRVICGFPDGLEVDHVNFNKLDNRRANLRICTRQQNARHLYRQRNNTSGYMGVRWLKLRKRWCATIRHDGKSYHCFQGSDIIEAARAYDAKARELFGEFANTNFPQVTP